MAGFIIYESDERMFFLKKELAEIKVSRNVHIFAPNIVLLPTILKDTDGIVVGGRISDDSMALIKEKNIDYHNILSDEEFLAHNSRLTAEGALNVLLHHSMLSLGDERVLVIGFGRTGAAVVRLFDLLGINLTIATTSSPRPAHAFGNVIPAREFDFSPYTAIINTAPVSLIADNEVGTMKSDVVYIDLASKPAISLEYAKYLGLDADIYPALPAKTAPLSAARAIKKYIMEKVL